MKIDIDKLTEGELIDLNHRIVERLRFLQQVHAHQSMLEFSIGDKVSFEPQGRPTVFGVIIRYNKKTVTVLTDEGGRWNVSPHFLRKVKDMSPAQPSTGNVVPIKGK
jgi:hypothetical protein